MKKTILPLLLGLGALCSAQVTTKFYPIPDRNVVGVGVQESENGELFLLLDTYCYTPGSIVIEGCPRGYRLYRLDASQDTIWTYPIKHYPDLSGLIIDPQHNKVKIFGRTGTESGMCNGNYIWADAYSGLTWSTVHNLDFNGNYLDSARFSVGDCFLTYTLARPLPGNKTLLGTQYAERGSQGPVTYAETRYFILDSLDNVQQTFTYPNKYYVAAKYVQTDSLNTLLIFYNVSGNQYEFVKINDQGAELWSKPYLGDPMIALNGIQQLNNGDIMLRAVYYDNQIKANVLNRYDANANLIWSKTFVGNYNPSAVGELANGNLLYGESLLNGTNPAILLRTLTAAGDSIAAKWYDVSPGGDNIRAIIPKGDSCYLFGDAFGGLDSIYGPSRAFLLYDNFLVSGVEQQPSQTQKQFVVSPNPTQGNIFIQNSKPDDPIKTVILFDCMGHNILTIHNNLERMDISSLHPGVYLMQISSGNSMSIHRVVKI